MYGPNTCMVYVNIYMDCVFSLLKNFIVIFFKRKFRQDDAPQLQPSLVGFIHDPCTIGLPALLAYLATNLEYDNF